MGISLRPELMPEQPPRKRGGALSELEALAGGTETPPQQPRGEGLSQLERLAAGLPVEGEPEHGKAASFIGGLGQGTTFGFADEILAVLEMVDKGQPYGDALETVRGKLKGLRDANPGTHLMGELAGGAVIPAGAASKAASIGSKIKTGATVGAVGGAVGGAGAAEGDLGDRAQGALVGGAVGGIVGGGAVPLVAGASRLGRAVLDATHLRPRSGVPGTATAPRAGAIGNIAESVGPRNTSERAADKLLEAVEQDRMTVGDITTEVGKRSLRPKPETINEYAGRNVLGLTETVNTLPGASRDMLENRLVKGRIGEDLSMDQPLLGRFRGDAERTTGMQRGSTSLAAEDIVARQKAAAAPNYKKAKFNPDGSPRLVSDPLINEALALGEFQEMYEAGRNIARIERRAIPTLEQVQQGAGVPVEAIDYMKRGLDVMIERGADGKGLSKPTARALRIRLNEVLDRVDELVPEYKKARSVFKGDADAKEALEWGAEAVTDRTLGAADIKARIAKMTPGEIEMARQGAFNTAMAIPGDVNDGGDLIKRVLGSQNRRERLEALWPSEKAFAEFLEDATRDQRMYTTRNVALRGSQTAGREAGKERLAEVARTKPGEVFSVKHWGGRAVEGLRNRQIDMMAESLGPMLTAGTEGAEMNMEGLMRELAAAEARRAAQATRQAGTAGRAGRAAGQQAGGRLP